MEGPPLGVCLFFNFSVRASPVPSVVRGSFVVKFFNFSLSHFILNFLVEGSGGGETTNILHRVSTTPTEGAASEFFTRLQP